MPQSNSRRANLNYFVPLSIRCSLTADGRMSCRSSGPHIFSLMSHRHTVATALYIYIYEALWPMHTTFNRLVDSTSRLVGYASTSCRIYVNGDGDFRPPTSQNCLKWFIEILRHLFVILPAQCYAQARYLLSKGTSVCLSVTIRHCVKTAEHIVVILSPPDNPIILVFCKWHRNETPT